jgi:hypothetical protein
MSKEDRKLARSYVFRKVGVDRLSDLPFVVVCGGTGLWIAVDVSFVAETSCALYAGQALINSKGWFRSGVEVMQEAVREFPKQDGPEFLRHSGVRTVLDPPRPVRPSSQWIDDGEPWMIVSHHGKETVYELDLLGDSDPAHVFRREFYEAVNALAPMNGG